MVETVPLLFDKLFGSMLGSIMGSPTLIALMGMFFFFVFGLALRLTMEIQIIMLYFFSLIILSTLITWIPWVIMAGMGLLLGVFLFYMIFRG